MELKKTLEELRALYELEPEVRDLYVEGTSDAWFFRWYLTACGIESVGVYSVDVLDVPDALVARHSLPAGSNKARLVALSCELADTPASERVICIADRDYDGYHGAVRTNRCLRWTDGNCLELYALSPSVFAKFTHVALGGFTFSADNLLNQCVAVLEQIYCMRAANEVLGWGMSWVPFGRYIDISGTSIELRIDALVRAYLQRNGRWVDREAFANKVDEIHNALEQDPKRRIRGHDLSELLYVVVNRVRREKRFGSPHTLESCLLASVETAELRTHDLFRDLEQFCPETVG